MWVGALGGISCLGMGPGPSKGFQHRPKILQNHHLKLGERRKTPSWVWIARAWEVLIKGVTHRAGPGERCWWVMKRCGGSGLDCSWCQARRGGQWGPSRKGGGHCSTGKAVLDFQYLT